MKRQFIIIIITILLGVFSSVPAYANNQSVQNALATYGDVSVFYAALLNTGVLNELDPNTHYTIFAPTNETFAQIRPNLFPCFYAVQCRAQVAEVLRDHIAAGRRSLTELTHEAEVPTIGRYRVYAESPYVGEYSVGNQKVLSGADVQGNMIYRLDGVIVSNQQLAQFRTLPPVANAETSTTVYYHTPAAYPIPGGGYPAGRVETVTEKTYIDPAVAPSTTVVYPDGTETTTTEHTYVAPGTASDDGQATTITRSVTTRP